jgi:hypothetical protein
MTTRYENAQAAVDQAVERYASSDTLRVAVQLVPVVGGAIDTILSGRGSRLQFTRLERFIGQLHDRLLHVEAGGINVDSDDFVDFMITCLEKASRARTPRKSQRFAEIVATQVLEARPWDEADMATRLLADLEDIHMSILSAALAAPEGINGFAGVKVVALKSHPGETLLDGLSAPLLNHLGNQYSLISLRLACSELVARGLLHDEGVGRWDSTTMTYFVATDLAAWLTNWTHPTAENLT